MESELARFLRGSFPAGVFVIDPCDTGSFPGMTPAFDNFNVRKGAGGQIGVCANDLIGWRSNRK
jgi:hypothetical protein